jgi:hypothetical protein
VKQLGSRPLRLLAKLSNSYPRVFYIMFGHGALLPFMEVMRRYLGARVFGYLAFCMYVLLLFYFLRFPNPTHDSIPIGSII